MAKKKKQIGIIGLGIFGTNVVKALSKEDCEIIAIDTTEEKIKEVAEFITNVVKADATDEKILKELAFNEMDEVVVAIGDNLEASILITMILKNMGVKNVIVKANSALHAKVLMKVGADKIVFPERDEAEKLAKSLISSNLIDVINFSDIYSLVEIKVPKSLNEKTLFESMIRTNFGLNVVAIRKKVPFITDDGDTDFKEELNISPNADDVIEEGDSLVIIGENDKVEKFKKLD
jgi:trk system potassium uptake protein TrkA